MKDINLLIDEERIDPVGEAKSSTGKKIGIAFLVLVVAGLMGAGLAIPSAYVKTLEGSLASIEEDIKSEKYDEVKLLNKKISAEFGLLGEKREVIQHIDNQGGPVNSIINSLKSSTPYGCSVNGIEYDNDSLTVSLTVEDISRVAQFVMNMDRLALFELSDSSAGFKLNEAGEYILTFDVIGIGG